MFKQSTISNATVINNDVRRGPDVPTGTIFTKLPKRSLNNQISIPPFKGTKRKPVLSVPIQVDEIRKAAFDQVLNEIKTKEAGGRTLFKLLKVSKK